MTIDERIAALPPAIVPKIVRWIVQIIEADASVAAEQVRSVLRDWSLIDDDPADDSVNDFGFPRAMKG